MKFRKKPVVIDAMHFDGSWASASPILTWMNDKGATRHSGGVMLIETLEGEHTASAGDWIIRGVKGEFYPCKPDIFAITYEPAAAPPVSTAYQDLALERTRQDAQWGGAAYDDMHNAVDWLSFIQAQILKAPLIRKATKPEEIAETRERLVKIGALAIAGIQAIDRAAVKFENVDG